MTTTDSWKLRHVAALHDPTSYIERGIVGMMRAVTDLVEGIGAASGWPDYGYPDTVASPAFGDILAGFLTLLNFELGRLDAGTLDGWARCVADQVGWDLDIEEIRWPQ